MTLLSRRCALLLIAALSTAAAAQPAASTALVTILDGEATLLRGAARFALAEGVRLQADDMLELGDKARLVRIEYADGASLSLGPGTRALLAPKLAARPQAYLLRGWAKLAMAPKPAAPGALASPLLDLGSVAGDAVLAVLPEASQVFAETGPVQLARPALALKPGEWLSLAPNAKPQQQPRPSAAFLQQVPRAFLDKLPSRAALFAGKERAPKQTGELAYADAQPWLDAADPALRRLALSRWKALARSPEFRRSLAADLKSHPEWEPVLFPPAPASPPAPAPSGPRY